MHLNSDTPDHPLRSSASENTGGEGWRRNQSTEDNLSITNGSMENDLTDAITIAAALIHSCKPGGFDSHPVSIEQIETAKNRFLRHMRDGGFESDRGWRRNLGEGADPLMPHGRDADDVDDEGEPVGGTHVGGSSR